MTIDTVPDPKVVPLRGVRGLIADKTSASLREAAQLTAHARADTASMLATKARFKAEGRSFLLTA